VYGIYLASNAKHGLGTVKEFVLSSEANFVGHTKVQTKSWTHAQTSEDVQNLDLLRKNAFIQYNRLLPIHHIGFGGPIRYG